MLQNYFKIAWRNITRNKWYAAINVFGLSLGITCCLFILLWVKDEKQVDNFHQNGSRLFTVYQTTTANGKVNSSYTTPLSFVDKHAVLLLEDIGQAVPEVEHVAFYATGYELPWGHPETFQVGEKLMKLEGSRTSADFFTMFSYPLIAGNAATALKDMASIAISRRMAELFFNNPQQAIGKSIRYENRLNFVVSAVFENVPAASSLKFDFLLNWDTHKKILEWASNDFRTYVQLSPKADVKSVENKINRYLQPRLNRDAGMQIQLHLQQYGDQYLHNHFVNGQPLGGRIEYVRIFSWVALFILLIACINFMNLATARSVKRAREVGLRKVVGSTRVQLIAQFFGESLLFALLFMLLSVILLLVLLPAFNQFTGKHIQSPATQSSFWIALLCITFVTGIVAGSYPALYLSSLQPVRILKGVLRFTQGAIWFRKGLTVFQFVLSIVLIVATIVITRQTNYVQHTNLGYNRENLVYIRIEGELSKREKYWLFKQQVLNMPGIAMVDRSTEAPHAMGFEVKDAINWEGKEKNANVGFKPSSVGFDFVKLMNLQLAEGRDFSPLNATDSTDAFMVNEEAVRQMGMQHPIGKWVSAWNKKGHIIAVLKDYHTQSLREPIKPVMIDVKEYEYFGVIIVRTQPGQAKEALASLEKVYKNINPNYPFTYQFVDEEYKNLYNNELVISKLSVLFATLAIVISCLGLLGLVMFAAEQRIREIGIRKVLGASLGEIVTLFSKDFLRLIGIAFLIAVPLAWYAMHNWLRDFAYRIAITWWMFALAGAATMLIALLTMSYQAIRAARANPVKSLRTE